MKPHDDDKIETFLARINDGDPIGDDEANGEARALGALSAALDAATADGRHFTLDELEALAEERRSSDEWTPPAHLVGCEDCLGIFEALLAGVPPAGRAVRDRYRHQTRASLHRDAGILALHNWREKVAVASVAAVIFITLGLLFNDTPDISPLPVENQAIEIDMDAFRQANGSQPGDGYGLSSLELLHAQKNTIIDFADGSILHVNKGTWLGLSTTSDGSIIIDLRRGRVGADVTPRRGERKFVVATALAQVSVVGTRFAVTCRTDDVVIGTEQPDGSLRFDQRPGAAQSVGVTVLEGVVNVSRDADNSVDLRGGETATIERDGDGILIEATAPRTKPRPEPKRPDESPEPGESVAPSAPRDAHGA